MLLSRVYCWDTYERREINEQKHITQSQKNTDFITNDDPSKGKKRYAAFLSRREPPRQASEPQAPICMDFTPHYSYGHHIGGCSGTPEKIKSLCDVPPLGSTSLEVSA
ncbi:hypothetical protein TNCV_3186811 [Trichonephila clavipes]|nr:hypothetical protein TNCV_3186811 [Trichonephila clavipes]